MKIRIITIAHKAPKWIEAGYLEYAKRFPKAYQLNLLEIPTEKKPTIAAGSTNALKVEGEKILSIIKNHHRVIALDVKGALLSTEQLAHSLETWYQEGQPIDFLIGGADGLAPSCLERANFVWSLSPLTFPHLLVRVMLAEQLYRAYSLLTNHPYHR